MEEIKYWNEVWSGFKPFDIEKHKFDTAFNRFFEYLGDLSGKEILDLGCGNGELSVLYAKKGAKVTSVDTSEQSIRNTTELAKFNNVESSVNAKVINAFDLDELNNSFDLVIGVHILHHIEPFEEFAKVLHKIIRKGGKGIFLENNARNPILMFFRKYIAGRFGVPRYGDNAEHPFEPKEIKILEKQFRSVSIYYPEFKFFKMLRPYLFRKSDILKKIFYKMDSFVYEHIKSVHKYSYCQIIEAGK